MYIKELVSKCVNEYKKKLKLDIVNTFNNIVKNLHDNELPILKMLSKVEFRKKHFLSIQEYLNMTNTDDGVYFRDLLKSGIAERGFKIDEIREVASNQMILRIKVDNIIEKWKNYLYTFETIDDLLMFTKLKEHSNEIKLDLKRIREEILVDYESDIIKDEINSLAEELNVW